MIQSLLMFLAPAQEAAGTAAEPRQGACMATRQTLAQPSGFMQRRKQQISAWLGVLLNAAGFIVFMAGLWLVLRLAELLLS